MDNKLLGLIGIGVAAYILLKKKEDETIAIISNDSTPKDPIIEPVIITNTEVIGCMDPQAQDYNPLATIPNTDANGNQMCTYDPTPVPPVLGCVDGVAENYNPLATADDGSCNYPIEQVIGCMDQNSITYNPLATVETQDGLDEYGYPLCQYGDPIDPITFGCTDPTATNYNAMATDDDGTCAYTPVPTFGCTDPTATNYNAMATDDDGTCAYIPVPTFGCTDPTATNYDLNASDDDGTCAYPVYGCPNPLSDNYDPLANVDDGSCIGPFNVLPLIPGCMDANANNYSPIAEDDDGSCTYSGTCYPQGCISPGVPEYGSSYMNLPSQGCSSLGNYESTPANCGTVPVVGCTDPLATNYDAQATTGCTSQTYLPYPDGVPQAGGQNSSSASVSRGFNGGEFMLGDY